ncbi:MAG: TraB/GumN family protein [Bacteroidota bacterium]|nr:TraB/GumN family protein [Bacteroidota bacterium]
MDKKSLLWSLEKDSHHFSYLFGTIHIHHEKIHPLTTSIFPFIKACDAFAAEIDIDQSSYEKVLPYLLLPDGETLIDVMNKKSFDKLVSILRKSFSISLEERKQLKPFVLAHEINLAMLGQVEGMSMDEVIWRMAKEENKRCFGLEDIWEHYKVLNEIPVQYQCKMLMNQISNLSKFKRQNKQLIKKYLASDIGFIYKFGRKALGKLKRKMLYDRNEIMATKIIEETRRQTTFFSCGTAHLDGKFGLLNLLKKQEYLVKPVRY